VQSDRKFVIMILQECVFDLGLFWGCLAALERWHILFRSTKIAIVSFYVVKAARMNLAANFSEFLFLSLTC
jgi:hypothetical protein